MRVRGVVDNGAPPHHPTKSESAVAGRVCGIAVLKRARQNNNRLYIRAVDCRESCASTCQKQDHSHYYRCGRRGASYRRMLCWGAWIGISLSLPVGALVFLWSFYVIYFFIFFGVPDLDTLELWPDAASLRARVCWCRRIFTYIHIQAQATHAARYH